MLHIEWCQAALNHISFYQCPLVEQYCASSRRALPFRFLSQNTRITLWQIRHHLTVLAAPAYVPAIERASAYEPPYEILKYDEVINHQSWMCISLYLLCKFVCPSGLQVLCLCMCDMHGPWEVWQVGCVNECVCVHVCLCGYLHVWMCSCVYTFVCMYCGDTLVVE